MNTLINKWLDAHPKAKQWLWFLALWLGGLVAVYVLTYPLKLLIRAAS